jgi:hypothetical protein
LTFARHLISLLVFAALVPATANAQMSQPVTDLTIEVEGDLLHHGGVVTVHHLAVSKEEWPANLPPSPIATLKLSARYTEVQLRHPADGRVRYGFRTAGAEVGAKADRLMTQVLSVIGSNTDNSGPLLQHGFVGANPSGGRVIRVLPIAEYAGVSDAERTAARWGQTQGYEARPPADVGGARDLIGVIERPRKPDMTCSGDTLVQACIVAAHAWDGVTLQWWRALAESRLERFRDRALARCYDDNLAKGGGDHCKPDPTSNEPAYIWRP